MKGYAGKGEVFVAAGLTAIRLKDANGYTTAFRES
jgi:hypothetical protein